MPSLRKPARPDPAQGLLSGAPRPVTSAIVAERAERMATVLMTKAGERSETEAKRSRWQLFGWIGFFLIVGSPFFLMVGYGSLVKLFGRQGVGPAFTLMVLAVVVYFAVRTISRRMNK